MTGKMHSYFNGRRFRTLIFQSLAVALLLIVGLVPVAHAQESTAAPSSGEVSVVRLNLRTEPSISSPVAGRLAQGTVVEILSVSDDGRWYEIATSDDRTGWLYAVYVNTTPTTAAQSTSTETSVALSTGDAVATPVATSPAVETTPAGTPAATPASALPDGVAGATTVPARMNVRGGPGTNYPVVISVAAGTTFEIVGLNPGGTWYQVRVPEQDEPAWVFANLTVLGGSLDGVPTLATEELPPVPVAEAPAASAPVTAVASSAPVAAPAAAPNTSMGFGYGITASMWQGDKQGVANLVKQLGFGWVKQQIRWEYAEPEPGNVQWQEMDAIVNTMNGNGINTMFSVVTSPPWARPNLGGTGGPPEDFQLFANFLGSIAGRYCGSLQAIEVWNEQNLRREWEGFPLEPASYMELLKRSYNTIKGACPSMLVISGATTPAGYSDVAFDDIDYLRGMYQNGLKQYSDGIGIHPSGFANPPSVVFEDWASGNYDALSHVNHRSFYFLSTLRESRRVMEEFGDTNKRLWPTEFGWGSTPSPFPGYEYEARIDEATQGRWIVDAFNIMAGSGYVAVPMLWNLNYPRDTEMGAFSVVGRPAFDALRAMTGR